MSRYGGGGGGGGGGGSSLEGFGHLIFEGSFYFILYHFIFFYLLGG